MTQTEALKLALEALEDYVEEYGPHEKDSGAAYVITTIKEALAQHDSVQAKPEPEQEPCGGCGGSGWVPRDPDIGTDQECFVCGGSGDYPKEPEQEPVAWPAGLIERIKAAEQRIQDGHAPRRIPADPTDVDLVLAEVRYLLEGKQPPFWVHTSPQPAQQEPLEYWNAVEGWVKIDEVREHFDLVGCGTIYKTPGDGRVPLTTAQRKPLTHEQRVDLLAKFEAHKHEWHAPAILIDMVEAAHGIKGDA